MSAEWDGVTRCDNCDNGTLKEWDYCPFCGHPQTDEGLAELDRLTKLHRLATPDPAEVRGRIRWEDDMAYLGRLYLGLIAPTDSSGAILLQSIPTPLSARYDTPDAARAALVAAVREAIGGTD